MANDPVSYEEATEERASRDLGDPEPEEETDPRIRTSSLEEVFENVKNRVETVPEWLKPQDGLDEVEAPDLGGRRSEFGIDVNLSQLDQLDTRGLMEVLVRVNVAQLAAQFDIADAVEPFTTITVSGTNAIEDADTAEVAVPESDDQQIPTRVLFVRASPDNDNKIYFGDDGVQPNSGFVLRPGEFIVYETDLRGEELYMASEEAGEVVQLLGMV